MDEHFDLADVFADDLRNDDLLDNGGDLGLEELNFGAMLNSGVSSPFASSSGDGELHGSMMNEKEDGTLWDVSSSTLNGMAPTAYAATYNTASTA